MSHWKLKINGKYMEVNVEETSSGHYRVTVDGKEHKVSIDQADWNIPITPPGYSLPFFYPPQMAPAISPGRQPTKPPVKTSSTGASVTSTATQAPSKQPAEAARPSTPSQSQYIPSTPISSKSVLAPMPGKVVKVLVEKGAEVKAGQGLCVLESMKMENTIPSPKSGKVTAVHVKVGESTNTGNPLVDIE